MLFFRVKQDSSECVTNSTMFFKNNEGHIFQSLRPLSEFVIICAFHYDELALLSCRRVLESHSESNRILASLSQWCFWVWSKFILVIGAQKFRIRYLTATLLLQLRHLHSVPTSSSGWAWSSTWSLPRHLHSVPTSNGGWAWSSTCSPSRIC